ncbi:MAG: hypothetical protein ACYDB9_06915 [Gammaproteobacteria bacterium]
MSALKTVKERVNDDKSSRSKPKSGVSYPYYDLNQSIGVANIVHEKAGGSCSREQLAPLLGYSGVKNGGFLTRLSAAKMFGLIQEEGGQLKLTDRAHQILSPVMPEDEKRAKADAFLAVELFQKVYEMFNGRALPSEVGLKNLFQSTFKIVPDRIVPALRVLMVSADTAGFLSANRDRIVMPLIKDQPGESKVPTGDAVTVGEDSNKGKGGGRGGGDPPNINPAIYGLIRDLPPAGTVMSKKKRDNLIAALTAAITYIYPEEESPI